MAEEYPKFSGVVLQFNNKKGYGFIKPDDGSEDLFVHHSDINSDGFRTLRKNQSVEFLIHIDQQENKTKAVDVTVIKNVASGGGRGGFREKVIECYNCCLHGHFARDCTNASYCLNCNGEFGHVTRDCKNNRPRSRGNGSCYNCGGVGHFAKDCPSAPCSGKGGSNGGDKRDKGGKCFKCDKEGHFARDCQNAKK